MTTNDELPKRGGVGRAAFFTEKCQLKMDKELENHHVQTPTSTWIQATTERQGCSKLSVKRWLGSRRGTCLTLSLHQSPTN